MNKRMNDSSRGDYTTPVPRRDPLFRDRMTSRPYTDEDLALLDALSHTTITRIERETIEARVWDRDGVHDPFIAGSVWGCGCSAPKCEPCPHAGALYLIRAALAPILREAS